MISNKSLTLHQENLILLTNKKNKHYGITVRWHTDREES